MQVDYLTLFNTCVLTQFPKKLRELDQICKVILQREDIYRAIEQTTLHSYGVSVPFPLVAVIHFRESDLNMNQHLHNGDPLTHRTTHVPANRPQKGSPPFSWIESATDAFLGIWYPPKWDIPGCLEFLERYNGFGYRKYGVKTPYLWDYTDQYTRGLFRADGKFDPIDQEYRPGCVALLKTLEKMGVSLDFSPVNYASPSYH